MPIDCPNCGEPVNSTTCARRKGDIRIRYRRCPSCNHPFRTEQVITPEIVINRQRVCGTPQNAKLKPFEVADIKKFLQNNIYTPYQLALQYDVSLSAIQHIRSGRAWASIEPAL
jgi:transcriptional regulator NrdR family protein